jgi:hypothetical protein
MAKIMVGPKGLGMIDSLLYLPAVLLDPNYRKIHRRPIETDHPKPAPVLIKTPAQSRLRVTRSPHRWKAQYCRSSHKGNFLRLLRILALAESISRD